jgi:hypothetical protein
MIDAVAVIVPVMRRPHSVRSLITSYRKSGAVGKLYFIVDHDDHAERKAIGDVFGSEIINYDPLKTFARKCNLGYHNTTEPWLLFVGDDVVFHPNWQQEALKNSDKALISTNDMLNGAVQTGDHTVHPIVKRSFIDNVGLSFDGPGTVCHEGYGHMFVDNEWTYIAKREGQFCFEPNAVVEHIHYFKYAEREDEVSRIGQRSFQSDKDLWFKRLEQYG